MKNAIRLNSEVVMPYRYLNFLSMLFVAIMLGTYVLAYKMVQVGPFIVSGGIFIFPLNYALTDITTEVYGFQQTKLLIKYGLICCLLFAVVVPLIALLPGPLHWEYQQSYVHVLGSVVRFFFANTLGIAAGILINSYVMARWKVILKGKYFWLRSIACSSMGELVTSIIADIIAFMGTMEWKSLLQLIAAIYAVKLLYAILLAFPNSLLVIHLKLKEGLKLFQDDAVQYKPFIKEDKAIEDGC
jgi:hypothetical protein